MPKFWQELIDYFSNYTRVGCNDDAKLVSWSCARSHVSALKHFFHVVKYHTKPAPRIFDNVKFKKYYQALQKVKLQQAVADNVVSEISYYYLLLFVYQCYV